MFAESKLTFSAWTGFGITAASIGTVFYQRSNGFRSSEQKNPGTGNKLIKKLIQDEPEKQKPKEQNIEVKKPDSKALKPEEENEAQETKKETEENHGLNPEKNQEEDQESFGSWMQSFILGEGDDDQLELENKK